jgi:hypothetical protein
MLAGEWGSGYDVRKAPRSRKAVRRDCFHQSRDFLDAVLVADGVSGDGPAVGQFTAFMALRSPAFRLASSRQLVGRLRRGRRGLRVADCSASW